MTRPPRGNGPTPRGNGAASRGNGPASRGNGAASRGNGAASRGNGPASRSEGRRGRSGRQWWARRWLHAIEEIGLAERLARGRTLARSGAVQDFRLVPGEVTASVAGPRGEAHAVRIGLAPIERADWDRLQESLSERALFAARLLSGEMPEEIEEAFAVAGLQLFPRAAQDLEVECGCADPGPGCPHVAALLYLMAERFDQDPFQILLFRGRGREELLEELRRRWSAGGAATPAPDAPAPPDDSWQEEAAGRYWRLAGDLETLRPRVVPPLIPEAPLLRLGPPPGAADDAPAAEALRRAYRLISGWALKLAVRENEPPGEEP